DADPPAVHFQHFPRVPELSFRAMGARYVHDAARFFASDHAAGIRAVRRDDLAVRQTDVREESFVTLHERAADVASFETHGKLTEISNYPQVAKCSTVIELQLRARTFRSERAQRRNLFAHPGVHRESSIAGATIRRRQNAVVV